MKRMFIFVLLPFAISLAQWDGARTQAQVPSAKPMDFSESAPYTPRIFPDKKPKKTKDSDKQPNAKVVGVPTVSTSPRMLTIPVAAYDSTGAYLAGLKPADFKVFVDDKEVEIINVATRDEPVTIVLMLDMSPSTNNQLQAIKNLALKLMEHLQPDDKMAVVGFNDQMKVAIEPTTDRVLITKAIKNLKMGDGTALYDAISQLLDNKLNAISGPAAIVLLTDGVDTTSRKAAYESSLLAAERKTYTIFPVYFDTFNAKPTANISSALSGFYYPDRIVTRGLNLAEYDLGRAYLTDLLKLSGGRPILASDVLSGKDALSGIAGEVRGRYQIKIPVSKDAASGKRHEIKIRIDRPDVLILAKGSYIDN